MAEAKLRHLLRSGGSPKIIADNGITAVIEFDDGLRATVDKFGRVEWFQVQLEAMPDFDGTGELKTRMMIAVVTVGIGLGLLFFALIR